MSASSLIGRTLKIGNYTVIPKSQIGEGGYAWVYRAEDSEGNQYALKYVNALTPERFEQFKQEAVVLQSLPDHPNIVKLYASQMNPKSNIILLLYELCPATAISILSKRPMTKEEILIFFTACAEATSFLHSQNPPIIHRDLKPENLLLSQDGTPKLCDFGSATTTIYKITSPDQINSAQEDIERNTTPNYRAPEMVDLYKRVPIGAPADVWALGCTLYKLVTREDLYKSDERLPILQGKLNIPPSMDEAFSEIISLCIKVDPSKRPTAAQIAGTCKLLRGPHDRIELPKSHESREVSKESKDGNKEGNKKGNWRWIKNLQDQYRGLVATGAEKWAIKATDNSNEPPDSANVRRILLATIRHTSAMSPSALVDFLLTNRPWQTDARIAAKCLYLILVISQYETNLSSLSGITVKTDHVLALYSQQSEISAYTLSVGVIGRIIRSKIMLHTTHTQLEGNLAQNPKNQKNDESLTEDLKRYLKATVDTAKQIIEGALKSNDFCIAVFAQPVVEEVVCAYCLLGSLAPEEVESELFKTANSLFEQTKKIPFLKSSIIYPGKVIRAPFSRFIPPE